MIRPEMKYLRASIAVLALVLVGFLWGNTWASEDEFNQVDSQFKNFVTCELTRNGAPSYFKGQPFTIVMVDLFTVAQELDLTVVTGAVQCFVNEKNQTLYVAVGVKEVMEKHQVQYFLVRHRDFKILGTELMQYPYKQKCGWNRYWVDTDS